MNELRLSDIRACLEGTIPANMATCAGDGTPNVAFLSQVYYVDEEHVALSFQFFNKTRQNILANPQGMVLLLHPQTAAFYRLHIRYLRTETSGPLFEGMKAQLAGIASHSGMQAVFKLLGADVYRVERVEEVPGEPLPMPVPRGGMLAAVRRCSEQLARCSALDEALSAVLSTLTDCMGMQHAMVLMFDSGAQRLYTVASCGYPTSGVGSEVQLGQGVIGVAARERTPVRITHMTNAATYTQAVRSSFQAGAGGIEAATEIPYPGLAQPRSQLAVPVLAAGRLLGVLFVESPDDMRFGYEDEDMLVAMAGQLGATMELVQVAGDSADATPVAAAPDATASGEPLQLRRFAGTDSVFVGDDYLIKGVAGAILWKLLRDYVGQGRRDFSNRELRLDPSIRLPDVTDNLEARLVLLRRRLAEQCPNIRIEKTGRGRFHLHVERPVVLNEIS
ncbi:MAG: GAF domain-containing protein [Ramlibacter sp.]